MANSSPSVAVRLTVNGETREAEVDVRTPLVLFLREQLGLTGTHFGCLTGHCGACTVVVNGSIAKSCTILAGSAQGDDIRTIEGVAQNGNLDNVQQAFWDELGFQCGYCTPGMILTVKELLAENPKPTEAEIRSAIDGNLCRCTGYQNIVAAVRKASQS